ncbi:MAG: hypothetical protein R3200_00920 [Xanthomonadales bacterium]|nr:hypothetical protein [Xanthomonadales bacterium]
MTNLRFGWIALAFFIAMGLFLESLHLVKLPMYFEVEIRRELWTLAHAHGALLAIVNVVFALCARQFAWVSGRAVWAGRLLMAAAVLVPTGFFLGGFGNSESDPSLWIVLTPLGALAALLGVILTFAETWLAGRSGAKLSE